MKILQNFKMNKCVGNIQKNIIYIKNIFLKYFNIYIKYILKIYLNIF